MNNTRTIEVETKTSKILTGTIRLLSADSATNVNEGSNHGKWKNEQKTTSNCK